MEASADCHPPVCVHPTHPKCLLFRGRPTMLVTPTEHYGAVMNRPFRLERYLRDCGARGINYTRLFGLFRELESPLNPASTCKPASADYIAPFERTGPGLALDGLPKYNLDRPNAEFFDRLHRFLQLASENNVVVEFTLLSNTYAPEIWALHPFHPENNLNGLEQAEWPQYMSRRHPKLFRRQLDHVWKMVAETRRYDNIIYEICNEPGGAARPGEPTVQEVNDWLRAVAGAIGEADATPGGRHLISGQEAFAYTMPEGTPRSGPDVWQFADESFGSMPIDLVNMHPLSNMVWRRGNYDLGQFMMAKMQLPQLMDYCLELYRQSKPMCLDEDNCATRFRDDFGWIIHRKRAWIALFCGAHYNCIDFSINNGVETGTADQSPQHIRNTLGHLAKFVHANELPLAVPMPELVKRPPADCIAACLGGDGNRYFIYLANARQPTPGERLPTLAGDIALQLPRGDYQISYFSPVANQYSARAELKTAGTAEFVLPSFEDDLVLCIEPGKG